MRTYDIIDDATGAVVGSQTCDDTLAPVLLAGRSARLAQVVAGTPIVDGDYLHLPAPEGSGEPLKLSDAERAALPPLLPADAIQPATTEVGEPHDAASPAT